MCESCKCHRAGLHRGRRAAGRGDQCPDPAGADRRAERAPQGHVGSVIHARSVIETRPKGYASSAPVDAKTLATERPRVPRVMPRLPGEYRCGEVPGNYGIPSNVTGWVAGAARVAREPEQACSVLSSLTLFFGPHRCIELEVEPLSKGRPYASDAIRVKTGTEELRRRSVELTGDVLRFFQTGNVRNYALAVAAAVLALAAVLW